MWFSLAASLLFWPVSPRCLQPTLALAPKDDGFSQHFLVLITHGYAKLTSTFMVARCGP
jgi:hypothetical protein